MDNLDALARLAAAAQQLGNGHVLRAAQDALRRLGCQDEPRAAKIIPFPRN